jgi:uncharacterized protein (DUF4415 family)
MRKEYDFSRGERGPAIPSLGKTRITIIIDGDYRSLPRQGRRGGGHQTLINDVLRAAPDARSSSVSAFNCASACICRLQC